MDSLKKKFKNFKLTPTSSRIWNRSISSHDKESTSSSLYHFNQNSIEYATDNTSFCASKASSTETLVPEDDEINDEKTAIPEPSLSWLSLDKQIIRKVRNRAFDFNLMILGCPGLGKSTLVNSFFLRKLCSTNEGVSMTFDEHYAIRRRQVHLWENGIELNLNIVDAPKFGSLIDNTGAWNKVADYIKEQHLFFEQMKFDTSISYRVRKSFDCRIHLCLYFIAPTGHSMSDLDIATLKALQSVVSIIPVIGRADCLNKAELRDFKTIIRKQLDEHDIKRYNFKYYDNSSKEQIMLAQEYHKRYPLAMVAGDRVQDNGQGYKVRVRQNDLGTIRVDDMSSSDFPVLHQLILKYGLWQLVEETDTISDNFFNPPPEA